METVNETNVMEPVTPAGSTYQPAPPAAEAQADLGSDWYWCPNCKLASTKAGTCPGCRAGYVAVPAEGVPPTPHVPKVRAGRSRAAVLGSVAGVVAMLGAVSAGIFLLATSGTGAGVSGAAPAFTVSDGTTAFSVGALHGTLRLPGSWGTNMDELTLTAAQTAGAPAKPILSVGKGSELVLMATFASPDPAGALQQFVTTKPTTVTDTMGNTTTKEVSRDVSIAGYNAFAQDFEVRNGKGGLIQRGTLFAVNAGDSVVVIRTVAGATQVNELAAIEQALVNIG